MADSIQTDDYAMQLAPFSSETVEKIAEVLREKRLDGLVKTLKAKSHPFKLRLNQRQFAFPMDKADARRRVDYR